MAWQGCEGSSLSSAQKEAGTFIWKTTILRTPPNGQGNGERREGTRASRTSLQSHGREFDEEKRKKGRKARLDQAKAPPLVPILVWDLHKQRSEVSCCPTTSPLQLGTEEERG